MIRRVTVHGRGRSQGDRSARGRRAGAVVGGLRTASRRLFVRLVAETLVTTIATMSAIVLVLTSNSSTALLNSTEAHLEDLAQSAASRLDAWTQLAQSQLAGYGQALAFASISQSGVAPVLQAYFAQTESTFSELDRKSTRLNSSHLGISYAVF